LFQFSRLVYQFLNTKGAIAGYLYYARSAHKFVHVFVVYLAYYLKCLYLIINDSASEHSLTSGLDTKFPKSYGNLVS